MRAAVLEGLARPLVVRELRAADPGPHEVVVRLSASGVCHTDLHGRTCPRSSSRSSAAGW